MVRGIGAGGVGVGTLADGKVVFLGRTAPGDRVVIQVLAERRRWAQGRVLEWLERGEGRCSPPCPRYARCDGCSLQHLAYAEQLRCKGRLVGDALRRIGKLRLEDPQVEASPAELRYRNRVTFTLRRLAGGRVVAGFRELDRPTRVLDVGSECLLPEEELATAWGELRKSWGPSAALLPPGRELRLTLRSGQAGAGLLVKGGRGDGEAQALLERVSGLGSVWRQTKRGAIRHLAGDASVQVPWSQEALELPGGGFVQVNRGAAEMVHAHVLREARDVDGLKVVDAYCGTGALGQALARLGAAVVGIEADPAAIAAAEAHPVEGFATVQGQVEQELAAHLPADRVVLNPPRSGLSEAVTALLRQARAAKAIYVSCDPATLARDLARLRDGYEVARVRAFDLFPQTAHVETVVTLAARAT